MHWRFWNKTGKSRELTFRLKLALSNQLGLRSRDIDPLRFIDQRTQSGDGRVTSFRIYDQAKLTGDVATELAFADLDHQPDALCFEGEIDAHQIVGRVRDARA